MPYVRASDAPQFALDGIAEEGEWQRWCQGGRFGELADVMEVTTGNRLRTVVTATAIIRTEELSQIS